jgi:hypothetical protein
MNRMLDPFFVAAVLEGFEGTLSELVERVECSELRAKLDVLYSQITALRASIEKPKTTKAYRPIGRMVRPN